MSRGPKDQSCGEFGCYDGNGNVTKTGGADISCDEDETKRCHSFE